MSYRAVASLATAQLPRPLAPLSLRIHHKLPRPRSRLPPYPNETRRWNATLVSRPNIEDPNALPPELRVDPPPAAAPDAGPSITLTPAAAAQIRRIQAKERNPSVALRLAVESGGCHGYQYKLELVDSVNDDDYTFTICEDAGRASPGAEADEPTTGTHLLVVDSTSMDLVKGSTVDYATELIGSSFRIAENPNAKGSGCGCGVSWELKDT